MKIKMLCNYVRRTGAWARQYLPRPAKRAVPRTAPRACCTAAFGLKAPAGQLLGDDAVLFEEKINFKMPGGDGLNRDSPDGFPRLPTMAAQRAYQHESGPKSVR